MCGNQKLFCCNLSLPGMYWLDIGAAQMSSKAFSPLGSSRKPSDITTSHRSKLQDVFFSGQSPRFLSRWKNSAPRIVSEAHQVPTTLAVRRREAVGLGLCLGMVDLLSQERISNAAEACELTVAPSGLAFCDKVLGNGPEAVKGQLIKAHYVGKLENGKVFDSSYSRGKPLTFRVGVGEVIRGWDQGILGGEGIPPMLAGGKRSLKLPPELAYGGRGAGCRGGSCIIPPDSVLLFDVEFIGKA